MRAGGIGRVIDSRHPDFAVGDEVFGIFGVQPKAGELRSQLKTHVPEGIDVYFDNVGERRWRLRWHGWLVARASCSAGPSRSTTPPASSVIFDYADRYDEGIAQLANWPTSGELRSHEPIIHGDVGDFPEVLLALFRGQNTGKLVLALDGPS